MRQKFKLLLISSAAVCLSGLSSCLSIEKEDTSGETAITFATPETNTKSVSARNRMFSADTKAAVNSPTDMNDFIVWGGYRNDGGTPNATNVFNGETVTGSGNAWNYTGGTRYWVAGKTYDFYAVYPAETGTDMSVSDDGTITVTSFDCSKTGADAVDLMTAAKTGIKYNEGGKPQPVALTFRHELARLKFTVKSCNTIATITGFKLYGVNYKGTLGRPVSGDASWTSPTACTDTDTPFRSNDSFNFTFNTTNGWEKVILEDLMLIPDPDLTDANLYIAYRYPGETADRTAAVPLKTAASTVDNWEAGKSYSYTLTIKGGSLEMVVSVNPWEEKNTSVSWQ